MMHASLHGHPSLLMPLLLLVAASGLRGMRLVFLDLAVVGALFDIGMALSREGCGVVMGMLR